MTVNDPRPQRSTMAHWAELVRLPNVFTVIADVAAAFLLVANGPQPSARFSLVVAAGISLYWAGMILNDVFDVEKDRLERPTRPLPSGRVSVKQATFAGYGLVALGIVLGTASGLAPVDGLPATWLPAVVATMLAVMVLLYDGPLKKTPLAPVAMGSCRVLSFLLGAAPMFVLSGISFPQHIIAIALGFGVYVMGITTLARREATGISNQTVWTGFIVVLVGSALLAFAPRLAQGVQGWHVAPGQSFPILIGLIVMPVLLRVFRLSGDSSPAKVQMAVRAGILTIIPLAAAFALLGAGTFWGLAIFGLVFPAIAISLRYRVT